MFCAQQWRWCWDLSHCARYTLNIVLGRFAFTFSSAFIFSLLSFISLFFLCGVFFPRWHSFFFHYLSRHPPLFVSCELIHLILLVDMFLSLALCYLRSFSLSNLTCKTIPIFGTKPTIFFVCMRLYESWCIVLNDTQYALRMYNMCSRILSFSLLYSQFTIHIVILLFLFVTKVIM